MADKNAAAAGAKLQVHRRTWNVDEYQRKADERKAEEMLKVAADPASSSSYSGTVIRRDALDRNRSRDGNDLQIDKLVGKAIVVSSNTPLELSGGFYCKVCKCSLKDSMSWLDHINGKKHNQALGMNMRCERATLEQVQKRMREHRPSDRKKATQDVDDEVAALDELDSRIAKLREEEEMSKEAKRVLKRQKKEEERAKEKEGLDDGFEAMMGFGGFGGKK
mmetsp:Transcript_6588/g.23299  ORF Transcript_6588/g.23299 Transcript_6588/m.23299 type:complete len:221 (-) Transcript_6588:123-785(-)